MAAERQGHETVTVVDPNFFQVVRLPLVRGDPAHALAQPESIVLSESMAHRYFGDADPVGRILRVSGKLIDYCKPHRCLHGYGVTHPLTVTGVMRDLPHNTQLVADFVVPNGSQADELDRRRRLQWTADVRRLRICGAGARRRVPSAVLPRSIRYSTARSIYESLGVQRCAAARRSGIS